MVGGALREAHARGVAVRILYNVDHANPIPVPPPPEPDVQLIAALEVPAKAVAGVPDLMHHKFVVRDNEAVWTGSMNWTDDSWSRQENVVLTVASPELAHAFTLDFEELWRDGDVEQSGFVEPRPVVVDGLRVRPWFTPGFARRADRAAREEDRARREGADLLAGDHLGAGACDARPADRGRERRHRGLPGHDAGRRRDPPVAGGRERLVEAAAAAAGTRRRRSRASAPSPGCRRGACTTSCTRRSWSPTTLSSSGRSTSRTRARRTPRTCSSSRIRSWPVRLSAYVDEVRARYPPAGSQVDSRLSPGDRAAAIPTRSSLAASR